jgi:hypothetical protein
VWPDNWPAADLFMRCQTQWRWHPDGRRSGLDYGPLLGLGSLYQGADLPRVLEDVQVIEATILLEQQ